MLARKLLRILRSKLESALPVKQSGAEDVAFYGVSHPGCRIAVVAPTFESGRDVCFEGQSGILSVLPPSLTDNRNNWNRSLGELRLNNSVDGNGGTLYKLYSSEKPDSLRGPEHHRAWCDELCSFRDNGQYVWDMLSLGLRLGDHPQCIITTTPKPIKLLRDLLKDPSTYVTTGSTFDNAANLAPGFINTMRRKYEGTRLGRQELYAELLDDMPGALWQRDWIEETRIRDVSPQAIAERCVRIVVAIDPAVTSGAESDLTGIIVAGIDAKGHGYVLADASLRGSPHVWASKAIQLLHEFHADVIVGEINNGGDMIESTIRSIDENVPYKKVTASRGKYVRAEPIASLYEQRKIHHVGSFDELEDEACMFTIDNIAKNSPNHVDASVWSFSELFEAPMNFGVLEVMKADAALSPKERMAMGKVSRSQLMKPVTGDKTMACIECGKLSVAMVGQMFSCSSCNARWMGSPVLGGSTQARYGYLAK